MNCKETRKLLSPLLDSLLDERREQNVERHLAGCEDCNEQYAAMRRTRRMLATLPAQPVPSDLALRIKVAVSRQIAGRRMSRWDSLMVRWENALNAFMFPATAGMVSAVLIFGLLIGFLAPARARASNDVVPAALYTPPEMTSAPFGLGSGNSEGLLVEAIIDPQGRVQDYRLLNGPETGLSPQMKNALIFTQFRPATSFGVPTSGRVILSFADVNVGG